MFMGSLTSLGICYLRLPYCWWKHLCLDGWLWTPSPAKKHLVVSPSPFNGDLFVSSDDSQAASGMTPGWCSFMQNTQEMLVYPLSSETLEWRLLRAATSLCLLPSEQLACFFPFRVTGLGQTSPLCLHDCKRPHHTLNFSIRTTPLTWGEQNT